MLILFDMDGVLFREKNVWLRVHEAYGTLEEGLVLTKQYLKTDYNRLVEEAVGRLLKGKPAGPFLRIIKQSSYNPGVKETIAELHRRGHTLGIITSGPRQLMERAQRELKIDDGFANDLVIADDKIAGHAHYADGSSCWPVGADDKEPFVRLLCKKHGYMLAETAFIGDSAADLKAFRIVGLPIAFNDAPEELVAVAEEKGGAHVQGNDLRAILPFFD
ncbi:TPA: HAD-IB family phosphatase [Candidatus Woesearchaeota archaeon]|nr:HAD-IB family phosphatase [Candidatus Woesearchaeota archaeon]